MVNGFLPKLMCLPVGFFDTKMTGDLIQRMAHQKRVENILEWS